MYCFANLFHTEFAANTVGLGKTSTVFALRSSRIFFDLSSGALLACQTHAKGSSPRLHGLMRGAQLFELLDDK